MTPVARRVLPIETRGEPWLEFAHASPARTGIRRIYAIGDIHGYLDQYCALQDAIIADLERHPVAQALVVHLGDIIDRGPHSASVVQAVIDWTRTVRTDLEVMCLRGNHDNWLAGFCSDSAILPLWAPKGGLETLVSYGLTAEEVLKGIADPASAENVRRRFVGLLPQRHKDFMLELPLSHSEGDYFFAHAGVDPDRSFGEQRIEDLTWIRDKFLMSCKNFGKVVVHGHTRRDAVESLPNRINVDTGIYVQQVLSCVILGGSERHLLQVGTPSTAMPALASQHA